MASILLEVLCGGVRFPAVCSLLSGTMIREMVMAAGALIMEAIKICPMAFGITPWRMVAYRTMTVPAMVAMPQVMIVKSSLLVRDLR